MVTTDPNEEPRRSRPARAEASPPSTVKQHEHESTDRVWTLACDCDESFDGSWMGDTPWAIDQCTAHIAERVATLGAVIPEGLLLRVSNTDGPIKVRAMYKRFLHNQTREKGDDVGAEVFERTFKIPVTALGIPSASATAGRR